MLGGEMEEETDETVVGCLPDYQTISNLKLLRGSFITQEDEDSKAKVAVIGSTLAKTIFGGAYYAYGEIITIEAKAMKLWACSIPLVRYPPVSVRMILFTCRIPLRKSMCSAVMQSRA